MPAPDPGLSNYGSMMPCWTRRMMIETAQSTALPDHGFFPLNGQNIDTPWRASGTRWTTDDDTHPLT
jgi:hypothetical protein